MTMELVGGLINLALALITLGLVLQFWWRHRSTHFARPWWIVSIAFGIFALSEALQLTVFVSDQPAMNAFGLTARMLFMTTLIAGLYLVFEDVLQAQQRALQEAQSTIKIQAEAVARAYELEVLARIGQQLTESLDLDTVLQELARSARELAGSDSVSVRVPAGVPGEFRFVVDFASAFKPYPDQLDPQIDELCWKVVRAGRPAIVEDAKSHPMFGPNSPEWLGSLAVFPLRHDQSVIGVLTVVFDKPHALTPENHRMLSALADQAAVAVRNAQLHESLERSARTDALTGLANRRRFNEELTAEIRRARRYDMSLALILADVDKLKAINDRYGHAAGDTLLQATAQALRNAARSTDLPARFGGDEFAVILPGTSVAEASNLVDRIQTEADRLAFDWGGHILPIRLSLGVSGGAGKDLPEAPALLKAADEDLYRAKQKMRSRSPLVPE